MTRWPEIDPDPYTVWKILVFAFFGFLFCVFFIGCVSIKEYRSGIATSYQKGRQRGQQDCYERKYWGAVDQEK